MILRFIRHGMTRANETTGICGLRIDWPLSESGAEQIRVLKEAGIYPAEPGTLYTSTLTRTAQTLEIVYPGRTYECTHLLDERDLGVIEYCTDPEEAARWRAGVLDENGHERPDAYAGGENFDTFYVRVRRDFNALLEQAYRKGENTVTVFGHGSYLRMLGTCFAVPGYTDVRPIVRNGHGFVFDAARNRENDFSLRITDCIGGGSVQDILISRK